ncbi:MAG: hypothetical protein KIT43_05470 [Bauldia sp.]|nr:hypothetical protein [Bauldia sp.]
MTAMICIRTLAAFAAVMFALPSAAETPPPVVASVGVPFVLRVGGEAIIGGVEVRVRFDRVTGDSRCPVDVMCVWAGVFSMALVVVDGAAPVETEVILDTLDGEANAAGLSFTLLGVKPPRYASAAPERPMAYAVLIRADPAQ